MDHDEKFMRLAMREAARGLGHTSPNPVVGALIVSAQGRILARGHHRAAGRPHAEIEALSALKKIEAARGATMYVTLEPCSTHGRTPPCVKAIIASGIRRVVIGAIDPNPKHAGRGVGILKKAGVEVRDGVFGTECAELNRAFNKWIVAKIPWVIAKAGMSLDGRITRPPSECRWITGAASRADAMKLRARVDAILIGAGTLRDDNPRLTVRGVRGAVQPWRIVLTQGGNLPRESHLFTDAFRDRTLVFKKKSIAAVLRELGKRDITSVLIEGGSRVLGAAFDERLVDEVRFYIAPLFVGGPKVAVAGLGAGAAEEATRIETPRYEKIGGDICVSGLVIRTS